VSLNLLRVLTGLGAGDLGRKLAALGVLGEHAKIFQQLLGNFEDHSNWDYKLYRNLLDDENIIIENSKNPKLSIIFLRTKWF
jgi:hypothetical protein